MSEIFSAGYFKLHRNILDWEWYSDHKVTRLFIHCLLKANHADKKWKGHIIKKGQFISSLDHLSAETGLTKQEIRTCINKLKSTQDLTQESTRYFSVFSLLNYEKWNNKSTHKSTHKSTSEQHTSNTPATTTKNNNNNNNPIKEIIKPFLEEFSKLYKQKTGLDYLFKGQDLLSIENLIKTNSLETTKEKMILLYSFCDKKNIWFTKDDGFKSFTIGHLERHWNSLIKEQSKIPKSNLI